MLKRAGIVLVVAGILVCSGGPVAAAPAESDTSAVAAEPIEQGSWLKRTLRRYFKNSTPTGDELDGRAVEIVGNYAQHVGKPIEVVLVYQVARFESEWALKQGTSQQYLNKATKPFQSYTRDRTIRQYLLFEEGQLVDPFLIADSERMLRNLNFIEDVRIRMIPLAGEIESVAIVVETRDRWPFGVAGNVKDVGRYEASLYFSNLGGIGLRLDNQFIYRQDREPQMGYQGSLSKQNIGGSFIAGNLEYEDSYRKFYKRVAFSRGLVHPAIKGVGGIFWHRLRERDTGTYETEYELGDVWLGKVLQLQRRQQQGETARPVLVPAVLFNRKTYLDRPIVTRDSLRQYHNAENYMVGLTYQHLKYYKTSYLFEMGETENLPSGLTVKLTGGYQDGEYHDRTQAYFQTLYIGTRNRGDVAFARVAVGGFFRDKLYEDGSLLVRAGYITSLLGQDRWRTRIIATIGYYLAINRVSEKALWLGNSTGLRGMADNRVAGNQRLMGNFEYRLFTPWSAKGFRFLLMGYLDAGTIGAEDDPILENKIYYSTGLAVRIHNPDLVLPAMQFRVSLANSIEGNGALVGFRIGGADSPTVIVPATRPGGFIFE